ncbi:MAG TPA: hypothetical protein VLG15_10225 [Thermoanaerobaculia bacterium]|nr:hypothetical protein [Thermoanaerobaculia bacterium]
MSETEEDRSYYAAGEAAFIARRGTPFLLSPRDYALLKEWRALGIPIEAVEAGIDEAFTRREERGATGRINSLSYCRDAVLSAWERRAETAVGRGSGRDGLETADAGARLARLAEALDSVARLHPELTDRLDSAERSLDRLAASRKTPGEVEASLARLDRRLTNELVEALPAERRRRVESRVEELLAKARVKMDRETEEKTRKALTRRTLREELALPRLTLIGE